MSWQKRHIKRSTTKTFCGCDWTVWRGSRQKAGQIPIPKDSELKTGTFEKATCDACIWAYQSLVESLGQYDLAKEFIEHLQREADRWAVRTIKKNPSGAKPGKWEPKKGVTCRKCLGPIEKTRPKCVLCRACDRKAA